jgi:hypothetical protein
MSDMINEGQEPMDPMVYGLGAWGIQIILLLTLGDMRTKKKRAKIPNARGLTFTTIEDVLLVKYWLAARLDPICGTKEKTNKYWEKIHKHYHEHKEYMEPNPNSTTHNVASLLHRWSTIREHVNKFVGHYASAWPESNLDWSPKSSKLN